ncbi:MAG: hypothetical protein RBU21_17040 [FCB group bacterium]|nr:hypothetical protein [FCB group bacterium]
MSRHGGVHAIGRPVLRRGSLDRLVEHGLEGHPGGPAPDVTLAHYEVYTANDGRNWSPPIASDPFPPGQTPTEIAFPQPIKTRWLRLVLVPPAEDASHAALAEVELIPAEQ